MKYLLPIFSFWLVIVSILSLFFTTELTSQRTAKLEPVDAYKVPAEDRTLDWFNLLSESGYLVMRRYHNGALVVSTHYVDPEIYDYNGRLKDYIDQFKDYQRRIEKLFNTKISLPWLNKMKILLESIDAQHDIAEKMIATLSLGIDRAYRKHKSDKTLKGLLVDLAVLEKGYRERHKMLRDAVVELSSPPSVDIVVAKEK